MQSDPKLRRLMLHYIRKYFPGMGEDVDVIWHPAETEDYGQVTEFGGRLCIYIDPITFHVPFASRITLLHELIHVRLWPERTHGKKFKAEMRRLFEEGAFANLL